MKYYKDENNEVYGLEEDGSQDSLILNSWISITDEERIELTTTVPTTPEEIRATFIATRTAQVAALTVEVNGKVFNGDEVSQSRMARAILASNIVNETTTQWTLANNISTVVTLDELKQALALSMQAMAAIWVQS